MCRWTGKREKTALEDVCLEGEGVYETITKGHSIIYLHYYKMCRVDQSVWRLTTSLTVRGSNPGGAIFSACPDRPWGPTSLLYNGYRVFPGGKVRPGRAADHSPPSCAAFMEELIYNSTHTLGHNWACNGNYLPLPLHYYNICSVIVRFQTANRR